MTEAEREGQGSAISPHPLENWELRGRASQAWHSALGPLGVGAGGGEAASLPWHLHSRPGTDGGPPPAQPHPPQQAGAASASLVCVFPKQLSSLPALPPPDSRALRVSCCS